MTAQVQTMYTEANHGFLIRDALEGQDAEQQFHSREKGENAPQLVVRFCTSRRLTRPANPLLIRARCSGYDRHVFMEESGIVEATPSWGFLVLVFAVALLAGCGGDDDDERPVRPVDGTFVGELSGSEALVAVVASPAERGGDRRAVTVYVSDGRRISESLAGSARGNSFTAASDDGEAEAKGDLSREGAAGTVALGDGERSRYRATRATAAAGLYVLTLSRNGKLSGASSTGVALTSSSGLRAPGSGRLRFADGRRHRFSITGAPAGDAARLRSGRFSLIVLPSGEISGAGEARPSGGGDAMELFVRSAKG
jgi:hypothetical protein